MKPKGPAMREIGFTADIGRELAARISARLIDRYGTAALDEALCVVSLLVELGRAELIPVWLRAALEITRTLAQRQQTEAA
jgi:hypothetical protein